MSLDVGPTRSYVKPVSGESTARAAAAERTRDALVEAATALFAEQGLGGPSLDAICARAGFTRGAFYVHFKTRDDLIVAVVERVMGAFIDAMVAAGEASADLAAIVQTFALAVENGAFPLPSAVRPHQVIEACLRSDKLRAAYLAMLARARLRLADTVRRGQREGRLRDDVDADAVAQLLLAVVLGVEVASELSVPYDARAVAELMLRSLSR